MLIAARTIQGFGAALLMPQTMAIITRIFPPAKRGAALGVWGAIAGVAALLGPILGGILVDWLGWKWIFLVNLPVGGVGLLLAVHFVPRLETHEHRFDFPGVAQRNCGVPARIRHTAGRRMPLVVRCVVDCCTGSRGTRDFPLPPVPQHTGTAGPAGPLPNPEFRSAEHCR
jgi:MFS family permease